MTAIRLRWKGSTLNRRRSWPSLPISSAHVSLGDKAPTPRQPFAQRIDPDCHPLLRAFEHVVGGNVRPCRTGWITSRRASASASTSPALFQKSKDSRHNLRAGFAKYLNGFLQLRALFSIPHGAASGCQPLVVNPAFCRDPAKVGCCRLREPVFPLASRAAGQPEPLS